MRMNAKPSTPVGDVKMCQTKNSFIAKVTVINLQALAEYDLQAVCNALKSQKAYKANTKIELYREIKKDMKP